MLLTLTVNLLYVFYLSLHNLYIMSKKLYFLLRRKFKKCMGKSRSEEESSSDE